MPTKAQIAYEFLILFFFLTTLFTFWFIIMAGAQEELEHERLALHIEDLGLSVQESLYTALAMPDGFSRNITLPQILITQDYDISIQNNNGQQYVIINTTTQGADFPAPPITVHHQPRKLPDTNKLTKKEGMLHLNEETP